MIMFPVILWYLMTKSSDLLISVLLWSWIILEEVLRHLPTTAALDAILRLSPEALTRAPPSPHQQHWPVHPTFWKLSTVYSAVLPPSVMLFYPHYLPYCHYHQPYHRLLLLIIIMASQQLPTPTPAIIPPSSSSPRHFDSISAFFFYTLVYSSSNNSWTWCMDLVHYITQRILLHFCAQLLLAWPRRWVHN